jgi:hypothetical protein
MTEFNPFDAKSDYEVPKSSGGNYLKLEKGQTTFLPLSSPIVGWEYWNNSNKPVRLATQPEGRWEDLPDIKPEKDGKYRLSHFWAFPVIDLADGKVKILEVTQKSIQNSVREYAKNPAWGNPIQRYTFTVSRNGDGLDTEYNTMANPPMQPAKEWLDAWKAVTTKGFNLNELYHGGDPFAPSDVTPVNDVTYENEPTEDTAQPAQ